MRELYVDNSPPSFPPLLRGEPVPAAINPFDKAIAAGMKGEDPGLIVYSQDETHMRVAILFAPDIPLSKALGGSFAVALGLADSLGALAPPELAVHFVWPDRFKVNGALCGHLQVAASQAEASGIPDWLVIGLSVPIMPTGVQDPGRTPDQTTLHDEGCIDITAARLIESFARHMLVWMNRFEEEGMAPLHDAWCKKCDSIGEPVETPEPGLFLGLDEDGNMLIRNGNDTRIIPLATLLEATS